MSNSYTGLDALRKEEKYAVSIDCNFVILKWEKSELDYIPTPEQGKELVLSVCRKHGLPEPRITYTADGLELKWYWQDRMTKENPEGNCFNHDWDKMQEELYRIFWYLGAADSRINRGLSIITTMFRVPGSLNTTKKLKTEDRFVRDIHEGEIVSSYRDIQQILCFNPIPNRTREFRRSTEAGMESLQPRAWWFSTGLDKRSIENPSPDQPELDMPRLATRRKMEGILHTGLRPSQILDEACRDTRI